MPNGLQQSSFICTLIHESAPIAFPSFARVAQYPKLVPKSCPNRAPTLTCGSSRVVHHNELLKSFLRGCNLLSCMCFLLQNPLCCLHDNMGLQFLCIVLHYLFYYALCSRKFFCYPKCFLLQRLKLLPRVCYSALI